jgi:hypothetical protein
MAQLLNSLPIGARVKFGKYSVNGETAQPIVWFVVAKNHSSIPAYPADSITLLTEKVIDYRAFDAGEPNNPDEDRAECGNNRYSLSNIDQWLNKDSGGDQWYSAQHSADQAPTALYVGDGGAYSTRPGFLNAFTERERNIIQNTTIRVGKPSVDGGGYEDISRKVFLASVTEVGLGNENGIPEGSKWEYLDSESRIACSTDQACKYTTISGRPGHAYDDVDWWLRTPYFSSSHAAHYVSQVGTGSVSVTYYTSFGVRPALNLMSNIGVSDTTDDDGCYTLTPNTTPPSPSTINLPPIYGGKANLISWGNVIDPDGQAVTYQLECSINDGAYTQIYSGASTTYAHLVPFGTSRVAYRVKATDIVGESSAYKTSATVTVINNNAPVISGADSNLGVKTDGFFGAYQIDDADGATVTVTEAIDGVQIRALVVTSGMLTTYDISGNTWLTLPNGSHTFTITATDGIDTSVRTYTFTKLVESFTIQNATPWDASSRPSRIMLVITRNIPSGAKFKVEVCNNGYDANPMWESATAAVTSGLVHPFVNNVCSANKWGVLVRVTVERNGASGACYVSAIGGNFE